jgi:predicted enzyme related to lactoylglutathione lyase
MHSFVYVQLHTHDAAKAKQFYGSLFDWRLEDSPPGAPEYTEIVTEAGPIGGMMRAASPNIPPHWLPFVQVDNVVESTTKAAKLGAKEIVSPTVVPQKGTYSVIADPTGAAIALWEPLRG